jgi:CRP/FNR family transcriptional regulator, cyclic AMP receptor protein
MDLALPSVFLNDNWFRQLAPKYRTVLMAAGRIRSFRDQQRIYRLGDPPNGLYGLISGDVRLIGYPLAGRQLLVRRFKPGEWFGELSTVDGGPRPHDAISFGLSTVLSISSADFERISRDNPDIFRHVARLLGERQRAAVQYAGMTVSLPVKMRLSHLLLAALDASEKPLAGDERTVSVTQGDIAAALGVSRQTTNKLLKSLEQAGAVSLGYGLIRVLDPARLHRASKAS